MRAALREGGTRTELELIGRALSGFLLGPILALRLGAAFVPVRKAGKLPGKCVSASYEKEYGTVSRALQQDLDGKSES